MIFYTENIVLYQICRNVYDLNAVVAMLQFYILQNMTMLSSDENRKYIHTLAQTSTLSVQQQKDHVT